MARKKPMQTEDGLKNVAVAVGSALGKLAHKIGFGGPAVSAAAKPPKQAAKHAPKHAAKPGAKHGAKPKHAAHKPVRAKKR